MRFNRKRDYAEASRRSIQRDFQRPQYRENKKRLESNATPKQGAERRIAFVGENSSYYKYRHLIIGKAVRVLEAGNIGGWICEFIHDADRMALNKYADWSSEKKQYLFDSVKFK